MPIGHRFEPTRRLVDNWRDLRELIWRQSQFRTPSFAHAMRKCSRMRRTEKKMACVRTPDKSAGHSTGNKDEEKSGGQSPFQCGVHCRKAPVLPPAEKPGGPTLARRHHPAATLLRP